MTTLYEQINTRKIVLPPELQEFFSTIYDTSKKYEFVYLGKNLAWKPLIASRAPSSEIHKKEEDILILKFLDEKFWGSEYAIAKQDWGFSQPIVFVPDPYKDNEVRKISRVERGTKFEVYAVVGTKTKYYTYKDTLKYNIEPSDLPTLQALAGRKVDDVSQSMKELPGARYWWLKDLFKEIGGGDSIPKDFGKDLGRSREVFDRLLHNQGTKYYSQVIPTIKLLRTNEKRLDANTYVLYCFLLLWQSIVDKNKI
jgi:hypothetical protein